MKKNKRRGNKRSHIKKNTKRRNVIIFDLVGIILIAGAILIALSLISFDPGDHVAVGAALFKHKAQNSVGIIGALLSKSLLLVFGFSSFLLPSRKVSGKTRRLPPTQPPVALNGFRSLQKGMCTSH